MGFAAGFRVGWDAVTEAEKKRERKREMEELRAIQESKPVESQGYTADQGDQLEAAAKSGQYDIGVNTNPDGTFAGYKVTPKADPTQSGNVAMQGVTDFMGERSAGSISPEKQERAKLIAMAGVLDKRDPMEGMRLRREVKSQDREDQRWAQQQKEWGRADEERNKEAQYRTEREQLLQSTPMGQAAAAKAKFEQDTAAYSEALKAGKTPQEIGPPPQQPNIQRPGPMQTLAGYADLIAHDYKYGKLNTDGLISFQDKMQKVEQENYVKALTAAQNGGSPEQVAKAFNAAGMQIDAKNVSISRTKQANGPDQVTLNYKDANGQTMSIPVMAELEAYDKAKGVYDRFYQQKGDARADKADARAERADGRAANRDAREQRDSDAKTAAALALFKEQNPNATAAQLEAAKNGILSPATGKGDKYTVEMGDVTAALGSPALDRNGNPRMDPITGKQMVNRDPKKEAEFFQWMRENNITDTNKGLALFMGQKREEAPKSIATDPRAIAIRDDKNLTVEQKRKKLQELGYQ